MLCVHSFLKRCPVDRNVRGRSEARAAVCITGQVRSGDSDTLLRSQSSMLLHALDLPADLFFYVNPCDDSPSPYYTKRFNTQTELEKPCASVEKIRHFWGKSIVSFKTYSSEDLRVPVSDCQVAPKDERSYAKWTLWKQVFSHVEDAESRTLKKYAAVVMSRPDLLFHQNMPVSLADVVTSVPSMWATVKHKGKHAGCPHISDGLFVLHRDVASLALDVVNTFHFCWTHAQFKSYLDVLPSAPFNTHVLLHKYITYKNILIVPVQKLLTCDNAKAGDCVTSIQRVGTVTSTENTSAGQERGFHKFYDSPTTSGTAR